MPVLLRFLISFDSNKMQLQTIILINTPRLWAAIISFAMGLLDMANIQISIDFLALCKQKIISLVLELEQFGDKHFILNDFRQLQVGFLIGL